MPNVSGFYTGLHMLARLGQGQGGGLCGDPLPPPKTWTSFVSLAAAQHRDLIEVGLGWWLPGGPWGVHLALHQAAEHEQGGGGVGSLGDDRVGGPGRRRRAGRPRYHRGGGHCVTCPSCDLCDSRVTCVPT